MLALAREVGLLRLRLGGERSGLRERQAAIALAPAAIAGSMIIPHTGSVTGTASASLPDGFTAAELLQTARMLGRRPSTAALLPRADALSNVRRACGRAELQRGHGTNNTAPPA